MKTLNLLSLPPMGGGGLHTMTILLLAALSLGGCNTNDPIATPVPTADCGTPPVSIIDGDTIKTVIFKDYKKLNALDPNGKNYIVVGDTVVLYKEPKLHTPPTKAPDLSKLKNNDDPDLKGKPLRYVAIGGSLTAGVRDGGYFNEGILTSYPNLIARQMKLQKFEQPLFDADSYNGFGRKVRTSFNPTGGPVPKFNSSKNNLGIENTDGLTVNPKKIKVDKYQMDNWGLPKATMHGLNFPTDNYIKGDVNKLNPQLKRFGWLDNEEKGLQTSTLDRLYKLKMDIFTIEYTEESIHYSTLGGIPAFDMQRPGYTEPPLLTLLKQYAKEKRKGCIANLPSALNLPYFKNISFAQFKAGLQGFTIRRLDEIDENSVVVIPNSRVDSLASRKVHIALKKAPTDVEFLLYNSYELSKLKVYNDYISSFAKETGYPVVDLKGLYEKITMGSYVTDDGARVSSETFFSTDGLYPSAFGQAIIANEFIKTLNSFYGLAIPLIPTKEYLNIK